MRTLCPALDSWGGDARGGNISYSTLCSQGPLGVPGSVRVCLCARVFVSVRVGNTDPVLCPQRAQSLSLEMQAPHPWECQGFLCPIRDRGTLDLAICPFLPSLPTPLLPAHHPPAPHPTWGHARRLQAEKLELPIGTGQPGAGTEHRLPAHGCVWEDIILEELFL